MCLRINDKGESISREMGSPLTCLSIDYRKDIFLFFVIGFKLSQIFVKYPYCSECEIVDFISEYLDETHCVQYCVVTSICGDIN